MGSRYQKLSTLDDPLEVQQALNSHTSSRQSLSVSRPQEEVALTAQSQQRNDLEESFDEHFDDNDHSESQRLIQPSYTPQTTSAQVSSSTPQPRQPRSSINNRPAVLPVSNDGVFSNMAAKPESERTKVDETPPAYDEAAADSTPPYWQTTIIAPAGMGDYVMVEGMPVGNILSFVWNLLVSASFQFVGFMLTYLLHTSHAAKQGSRAGLGISLVQTGFYIRSRGSLNENLNYGDNYGETHTEENEDDENANIIAYFLMMLGWFIIVRSVAEYVRARKMERIIGAEPNAEAMV
ncbi:hypothetical protein J3Q64DRAFT_1770740 [Phycomyces blakesleeanus]|uniref:Metal homeostatis protein bsd2 n=2 Tax=Phycomyces blakesleeanus TaxID=4837 RepID=A0A167L935_PHYB8|nr:hypothetical protein PHYBLDRAFT_159708 [Phycomyces blakesleeanus NRRL 1555(-)]OAD69875.1 hypothetical protein PHYBLDRAFT_159708 [Phycomyces blakesleeanus NRRL 1555(-)]|eukprot:XP_018287915.1 hypothetical protein PHYBLDRAFT_159708 [Phycomyces blakesleeanus NRRL 1555(-)]